VVVVEVEILRRSWAGDGRDQEEDQPSVSSCHGVLLSTPTRGRGFGFIVTDASERPEIHAISRTPKKSRGDHCGGGRYTGYNRGRADARQEPPHPSPSAIHSETSSTPGASRSGDQTKKLHLSASDREEGPMAARPSGSVRGASKWIGRGAHTIELNEAAGAAR
jgi:hypothetical protein